MRKFFALSSVALAALLAAPAAGAEVERAPARVVAVESRAAPFEDRLVLRGRTEADRRVEVRAQIAGLVVSEPLRAGAMVRAGDPLCALDPGERPAALAEAEATLRQAELDFEAAVRLSERGFAAETEALTREARREAARAQVNRAEIDMARLTMTAPFDGVLETDTAELGALLQPGAVCAELVALDPIALVGFASERAVDRLAPGQPVTARLSSGATVKGAIRFVARVADAETRTFRVEAAAPNPDLAVRDGVTAEIVVSLPPRDAHFLPQSALTLDRDGRLGLRLAEDGRARFQPVAIISDARDGVWLDGLPEVATVIVVGQEFVDDGRAVTVELIEQAPPP
ncbi:MAG: efflux RND transporter periplasmic adaptor subunit [Rhodobacteraceae bacterium]|nr:MAG: efflux RND transporter periplasmic adaptor subunit [Paracoccaceae bacterium]